MSNIKYLDYNRSYENDVIRLLNLVFEEKRINSQSFNWKHFDEYFKNKSVAMVAIDDETQILCSFVCFTPVDINYHGKNMNFYSCAIQATDPRFRKRGLVSDLTLLIEKKLGEVNYLGFSNSDGVMIDKYSKRINYEILGQLKTFYRLTGPFKCEINLQEVSSSQLNPLNNGKNMAHFNYNGEYLNWRYSKNPKNDFLYFSCMFKDEEIGFVILKKRLIKYEVSIVYMNDFTKFDKLIDGLSHYAFKHGILLISISLLPNKLFNNLKEKFIYTKDSGIYFTVKTSEEELNSADNWIIQGGDVQ